MKLDLRALVSNTFESSLSDMQIESDPVEWSQRNFAASLKDGALFSNQIESVEAIHHPVIQSVNVLASRGAGKTAGIGVGLGSLGALRPDTGIICSAPIKPQANKIIRVVTQLFERGTAEAQSKIDWESMSASRIQFKNGSFMESVSGQETANVEGAHGPVLYVDEAHLVPGYSMTNKLTPMNVSLDGFRKIIKSGVSMNRSHFYRSCTAPGAKVLICPWWKAELFLNEPDPLLYKKRQYSRQLIRRMPLSYKRKYFPDRPDLHILTGDEVTELDWRTQYELEWVADIMNALSEENQALLVTGKHNLLTRGIPGEVYCVGLDTAPGSGTGRWSEVDKTVLAIWRFRKNGLKERVACFTWQGNVLGQEEEIWQVVNHKTGLFKCEVMMADYSNIAVQIVERFKKAGMPVVGVNFGGTATQANSKKNWKNTLFDNFMVELESDNVKYPNIQKIKDQARIQAPGRDMQVQIDNVLEGFSEWCILQRIKGKGLNDQIEAPADNQEEAETGLSDKPHDDHCLTGETLVKMLDGTQKSMRELAEMNISDQWVYSLDSGMNIVPGKINRAWKTGVRELVRVTLDNGQSFRCTPDHRVMLRDGTYTEAKDLFEGQAVRGSYKNHKVVCVTPLSVREDVYDLEVEAHHNFALACGVFVHNCVADYLGVYACDNYAKLKQEASKNNVFGSFEFPIPVIGPASGSMWAPDNPMTNLAKKAASQNPFAQAEAQAALKGFGGGNGEMPTMPGGTDGMGYISTVLSGAFVKKGGRIL